jgi:hypothetical protein
VFIRSGQTVENILAQVSIGELLSKIREAITEISDLPDVIFD